MKYNLTKQDLDYTNEKIDLGSIDATYIASLIFIGSILLTIVISFKEVVFSVTPLMILTCIPLFAIFISLFFEIRSIFNGKIKDKFWSIYLLIMYGLFVAFSAVGNLLYYLKPEIFSKITPGGKTLEILFVIILLCFVTYIPKKLLGWFHKKFPIHFTKEKKEYLRNEKENNIMSNNKNLLKLEYEHHRTFAFAEFAALLVLAFGVIANIHRMEVSIIILFSVTFLALLIGFVVSFKKMNQVYSQLKVLLE